MRLLKTILIAILALSLPLAARSRDYTDAKITILKYINGCANYDYDDGSFEWFDCVKVKIQYGNISKTLTIELSESPVRRQFKSVGKTFRIKILTNLLKEKYITIHSGAIEFL